LVIYTVPWTGEKRPSAISRQLLESLPLSAGIISCFGFTIRWRSYLSTKTASTTRSPKSSEPSYMQLITHTTWDARWRYRPRSGGAKAGSRTRNPRFWAQKRSFRILERQRTWGVAEFSSRASNERVKDGRGQANPTQVPAVGFLFTNDAASRTS
jgi:hypothetical protein